MDHKQLDELIRVTQQNSHSIWVYAIEHIQAYPLTEWLFKRRRVTFDNTKKLDFAVHASVELNYAVFRSQSEREMLNQITRWSTELARRFVDAIVRAYFWHIGYVPGSEGFREGITQDTTDISRLVFADWLDERVEGVRAHKLRQGLYGDVGKVGVVLSTHTMCVGGGFLHVNAGVSFRDDLPEIVLDLVEGGMGI